MASPHVKAVKANSSTSGGNLPAIGRTKELFTLLDEAQSDSAPLHGVPDGSGPVHYSARAAISNAIVRIHARSYGRGPTKARTVMGEDYAMCILENIYTPVERTLIDAGRGHEVTDIRGSFQEVAREQFTTAVEEVTGRRVRAFFSQVHQNPDVAVEVFLFHPIAEETTGGEGSDG
jgi:uncharacterized protein YbcI